MQGQDTPAERAAPATPNGDRERAVALVQRAEVGRTMGRSVRGTAAEAGVADSTLYRWMPCKAATDASPAERVGGFLALSLLDRFVGASLGSQ